MSKISEEDKEKDKWEFKCDVSGCSQTITGQKNSIIKKATKAGWFIQSNHLCPKHNKPPFR